MNEQEAKKIVDSVINNPTLPEDLEVTDMEFWGPNEHNQGGVAIGWKKRGVGFGELTFYVKDGKFYCDSETMGPKFVGSVVQAWMKTLKINDHPSATLNVQYVASEPSNSSSETTSSVKTPS